MEYDDDVDAFLALNPLIRRAFEALRNDLAKVIRERDYCQQEMQAVWTYLQSVSPWSESNDMDWSDEIICGIDILKQDHDDWKQTAANYQPRSLLSRRHKMGPVTLTVVQTRYEINGNLETEAFYLNNQRHNDFGPAYRSYHLNGTLHSESFFVNGKFHNTSGPAYRAWDKDGVLQTQSFYLNGLYLSKEAFEKALAPKKEQKIVVIDGVPYFLTEIKND